jgi:TPR repeat protein
MHGRTLVWVIALALLPAAARAQFYDLDGAYRCLTSKDQSCVQTREEPVPQPPQAAKPVPSFEEIIARVRQKKATVEDIRLLQSRADGKDARAIEVLAWCRLNGIGTASDAVAAYWLYREAADLGVANARKNQIAIYETRLSPEQRQQVLMRENAR